MRPCGSSAWRERSWPREHPSLLRTGLAASVPLHHGRAEPVTLRERRPRPGSGSRPAPLLPCPPPPIWSPPWPSPSPPSGRRPGCPCTGGAFPSGQPWPPGSESDREGGPRLPGTPSPQPEGVWGCVPCPAKVQGGPRHRNGVSPSEGHRGFSALLPAWGMTATAHGLVPRDAARPSQAAVWLPSRPRLWSHQPWDSDGQCLLSSVSHASRSTPWQSGERLRAAARVSPADPALGGQPPGRDVLCPAGTCPHPCLPSTLGTSSPRQPGPSLLTAHLQGGTCSSRLGAPQGWDPPSQAAPCEWPPLPHPPKPSGSPSQGPAPLAPLPSTLWCSPGRPCPAPTSLCLPSSLHLPHAPVPSMLPPCSDTPGTGPREAHITWGPPPHPPCQPHLQMSKPRQEAVRDNQGATGKASPAQR